MQIANLQAQPSAMSAILQRLGMDKTMVVKDAPFCKYQETYNTVMCCHIIVTELLAQYMFKHVHILPNYVFNA